MSPEDYSTDGQFLDDIGRRKPGPDVKSQPDHQVKLQGTEVIAKGVPADREIQFFGLPDYQESEVGDVEYEDGPESEEYNFEEYDHEGDSEGETGEDSGGGGMSALDKALLAADVACLLYTSPSPRDLSTSRMPSSA